MHRTVNVKFQFRRDSDMLFNSQTYIASYRVLLKFLWMRVNNLSTHSQSRMQSTERSPAKHVPLGVDVKSALFMFLSN